MRRSARVLVQATALCILAAGFGAPRSLAGTISFKFAGTITSVSPAATTATGVVTNDTITGTFAYDPTQTGSSTTGVYTYTGSSKVHSFTFNIFNAAGAQVFSDKYSGNTTAFYELLVTYTNSANGTTLQLMGDTIYKQGHGVTGPGPPPAPAFDLTLFNPKNIGYSAGGPLPLPTSTTINNFVATTGQLAWDPDDQSFTASIPIFINLSIPEPSSLILGTIALGVCAASLLVSRRQRCARRSIEP
jgi:hypothetical protein